LLPGDIGNRIAVRAQRCIPCSRRHPQHGDDARVGLAIDSGEGASERERIIKAGAGARRLSDNADDAHGGGDRLIESAGVDFAIGAGRKIGHDLINECHRHGTLDLPFVRRPARCT